MPTKAPPPSKNRFKMKNTEKIMHTITKHSDLILLFFALISFGLLGVFKAEYYNTIFAVRFNSKVALGIGVLTALLIEGTRFALMLSSAEDARRNRWGAFGLGLLASIGLLCYDVFLCAEIGSHWNGTNPVYTNILQFIAILGGILEFRLCLLMKGGATTQEQATEEQATTNTPNQQQQNQTNQQQNQTNQQQNQNGGLVVNVPNFPFYNSTQTAKP